ncbi:MAG: ATP-binding cassette domain-containing protein [Candidatus Delongbacteria bacterium]|nr:ATP-binding cassette domain-containing protein [Candidatus Delongbacteria bacterium]
MIQVENISKTFPISKKQKQELETNQDSVKALTNVNFLCNPGKVFSLLGPNGAGKTTLLRLISTILKPTSGNINVLGFDTIKESIEVRRNIGFMTASAGLYERLTVNEYIKYFASLYNIETIKYEKRKKELYDILDINFGNRKIGQLSTGMKQKVSIVRTMIHDPKVVIFDEPTTGLDVITAKNTLDLIKRCKEENKTVIFSSHIMSEVELLSDDLAILYKGEILFNGSIDDFKKNSESNNLTQEFINYIEKVKTN